MSPRLPNKYSTVGASFAIISALFDKIGVVADDHQFSFASSAIDDTHSLNSACVPLSSAVNGHVSATESHVIEPFKSKPPDTAKGVVGFVIPIPTFPL